MLVGFDIAGPAGGIVEPRRSAGEARELESVDTAVGERSENRPDGSVFKFVIEYTAGVVADGDAHAFKPAALADECREGDERSALAAGGGDEASLAEDVAQRDQPRGRVKRRRARAGAERRPFGRDAVEALDRRDNFHIHASASIPP